MSETTQDLLMGLVEELALIVGAYGDAPADVTLGEFPQGRQLVATFTARGAFSGTCTVVIDYVGAEAIARLLVVGADQLSDSAIADSLRGVLEQAAASLASRGSSQGLELTLVDVESGADSHSDDNTASYAVTLSGVAEPVSMAVTWSGVERESVAAEPAAIGVAPRDEQRVEDRIEVILDIDLPIVVRFGHTEMAIRLLTRLGMGSVIDLGRSPDDPVELLVSDRVIAHGEVVIVGGNYGIRILDVASPAERVRSMEG
jgi:flagellar motor switch protein FliN/FliY